MSVTMVPAVQPGDIVVTSGDHADWLSRLVMWVTDSAWTHVFLVTDGAMLYESWFPGGVRMRPLTERFVELHAAGQTYRVLRVPALTPRTTDAVLDEAHRMLGRKYDVLQAVLFGLFHLFVADGPKRVICSRFITACFAAAGIDLFPAATIDHTAGRAFSRYAELRKGWVIPQDFIEFAALTDVTTTSPPMQTAA